MKKNAPFADHPKIHPVGDVETPLPTASSMPRSSATSEKASPLQHLSAPQRAIPLIHSRPPANSSCNCGRCCCCTFSILVLLAVIIGAVGGTFFLVFRPKLPQYSVDNLRITDLRLNFDMSLYAAFNVRITANNPNKKIGIYYEKGGKLSVWYNNTRLCYGSLPIFYQGHQNTTRMDVALTGQTQYANTLMSALQEQQQTGRIPLDLKVDAPVAIKLGQLKLKKVGILGHCLVVVDSLTANNKISIKASSCSFGLKI